MTRMITNTSETTKVKILLSDRVDGIGVDLTTVADVKGGINVDDDVEGGTRTCTLSTINVRLFLNMSISTTGSLLLMTML